MESFALVADELDRRFRAANARSTQGRLLLLAGWQSEAG
jgi:hypothetical protein